MARYEITAPNGKRFEITAPDGATQDEVMAYAQSQFSAQEMPQALTDIPIVESGNIDLFSRPIVKNRDGSISTVRSMSFQDDSGLEVLVPTVSEDGRILSDDEAIDNYYKTGKHLGKFKTPDAATAYANSLHKQQEKLYTKKTANLTESDIPLGLPAAQQTMAEPRPTTAFERFTGAAENVASNTLGVPLSLAGQAVGSVYGIGEAAAQGKLGTMAGAEQAQSRAEEFAQRANIFAPRTQAGQEIAQAVGEQLEPLSTLPPVMAGVSPASAQMRLAQPAKAVEPSAEAIKAGEIRRGSQSAQLAGVEVSPDDITKTITSKAGKEAMRQGFEPTIVQMVKQSTDIDRRKMNKMLDVTERAKDEAIYGAQNRPSDIAGESLKQKIDYIKSVNRIAGEEIDAAASKLKNETVDYSNSVEKFIDGLDKLGVKVKDDGISFAKSDIDEFPVDKRIISQTINRIQNAKNAEDVHRIKRFIDNKVSYGTKSQGGITRETINVLKELRANIDADLDGKFADYDKANTKYSKTIRAIGNMQDASGTIDLFSDNAEQALGTRLRSLLSNNQNRQSLTNAIAELDNVSKEFGGKFDDNVQAQVLFADALERVFKVGAKTSLRGETTQAIRDAAEVALGQKTVSGVAMEKGARLIEKARGINEQNAMKSLRELVKEKETP